MAESGEPRLDANVEPDSEPNVEVWMRGPIPGVHPFLMPVLFSWQQAAEDLTKWTEGLTQAQLWAAPHDFGSVGFHVRHITGSVDRLLTYLQGGQLTAAQLAFLQSEKAAGATRGMLLDELHAGFDKARGIVTALDVVTLGDPREVGRKRLPTTVIGLLVHIAEHTQRHVGQAISAAKWARTLS